MSDHYVGEIRIFSGYSGKKVPQGWAPCNGQVLPISGNEPLYSLLGAQWGGDGRTTFGLPNLNGRVPVGQGSGAGLTPRTLGQTFGTDTVTLTGAQMPAHNHTLSASSATAETPYLTTSGTATLSTPTDGSLYYATPSAGTAAVAVTLAPDTISSDTGQDGAHNNLMPSIGLQYMIALLGIYPVRP